MGAEEVILDSVVQGRLPKEVGFEQRPEGSEDQTMKKSIPDEGKQQARRQGGRSTLGIFEEQQGRQRVRAVPPSTTDTSHIRLWTSKFIKTKKRKN